MLTTIGILFIIIGITSIVLKELNLPQTYIEGGKTETVGIC